MSSKKFNGMNKDNYISRDSRARNYYIKKERKKWRTIFWGVGILLLAVGILAWRYYGSQEDQVLVIDGELKVTRPLDEVSDLSILTENLELKEDTLDIDELVLNLIKTMSIEDKVAQLFITTPEELTGIGLVVQAGEATKKILMNYPVGGLVYASQNFETNDQLLSLVNGTRIFTRFPTFMGVREDASIRVSNTNTPLVEMSINLEYVEDKFYVIGEDKEEEITEIIISKANPNNVVDLLKKETHMFYVESNFISTYNALLSAVSSSSIPNELLDEKLLEIMKFKVTNGVQ